MKRLRKWWPEILLITVILISTVIKIIEIKDYNFPFTMDQGRDMTDIRQMVVIHTPRLVGPTTSINGVLLGPFWYYFNLLPFVVTGGNPGAIVIWQIIWYQLACVLLYYVLSKKSQTLALFTSIMLLMAPFGFNTARYFWNANSMPIFTIIFFALLFWSINSKNKYFALAVGLIAGIAMQIEAAFGIIFFPFLFIFYLFTREKFKTIFWTTVGFGLTLIPQVLFEIRHGFIMTKILVGEFSGKGEMLGEKITLVERLVQRGEHLINLVRNSSHLPENLVFAISAISLIMVIIIGLRKKADMRLWATIFFVMITCIFYIIFPQKLKIWYTLGFSVPIILIVSFFGEYLWKSKYTFFKVIPVVIMVLTIVLTIKSQLDYMRIMKNLSGNDPSNLQNEIKAVDWVYEKAAGRGFNLYSYLPSVYDFPYQHVFWWYGTSKYNYQPAEISYLPKQPEYINRGDLAWTKKRDLDDDQLTFLIMENDREQPKRQEAWLGNFSKLCTFSQFSFGWGTQVRMLTKCQ